MFESCNLMAVSADLFGWVLLIQHGVVFHIVHRVKAFLLIWPFFKNCSAKVLSHPSFFYIFLGN